MADLDDDGPDLETLQAQIDMSMAFTQNLVSGWMKASKVKLPSSQRQDDRELEDYMRRPPRYVSGRVQLAICSCKMSAAQRSSGVG